MNEQEAQSIAADVDSGSYFNLARNWYSELYHTPIAQRSYYIVIILLSVVNMYFAVKSFLGVFPIDVPAVKAVGFPRVRPYLRPQLADFSALTDLVPHAPLRWVWLWLRRRIRS